MGLIVASSSLSLGSHALLPQHPCAGAAGTGHCVCCSLSFRLFSCQEPREEEHGAPNTVLVLPGASIVTHYHVHAIYVTRCEDECNHSPGTNLDVSHRDCQNGVRNPLVGQGSGKETTAGLWKVPALSPMSVVVGFACGLGNPEVAAVPNLSPACHTVSLYPLSAPQGPLSVVVIKLVCFTS